MKETSFPSGDNPPEPTLRWHDWLAFFAPAMICVSFAARGKYASGEGAGWGLAGLVLAALLCVVNGFLLARFDGRRNYAANACLWILGGFITNGTLAFGGCAMIFR